MNDIKAIPTKYNGVEFRSRLEARWAVFFDRLGVKWLYEYEGYQLPSGWYVPDFYLPEIDGGIFVEIKPVEPTESEQMSCEELCEATGQPVALQWGCVENGGSNDCWAAYYYFLTYGDKCEGFDMPYLWCECSVCGRIGIEWSGYASRIACGCDGSDDGVTPRILSAYEAARKHRFW